MVWTWTLGPQVPVGGFGVCLYIRVPTLHTMCFCIILIRCPKCYDKTYDLECPSCFFPESLMVAREVGVEPIGRNGCIVPIALAVWTWHEAAMFFLPLRAERDGMAPSLFSYLQGQVDS